jgi:hypothetical protein
MCPRGGDGVSTRGVMMEFVGFRDPCQAFYVSVICGDGNAGSRRLRAAFLPDWEWRDALRSIDLWRGNKIPVAIDS